MLLCNLSWEQTFAVASQLSIECSVTVSSNLPHSPLYLNSRNSHAGFVPRRPLQAPSVSKLRCRHLKCFFPPEGDSCFATHIHKQLHTFTNIYLSSYSLQIFPFFLLSHLKVIMKMTFLSKKSTVFGSFSLAMSQLLSHQFTLFSNFEHVIPSDLSIFLPFSQTHTKWE